MPSRSVPPSTLMVMSTGAVRCDKGPSGSESIPSRGDTAPTSAPSAALSRNSVTRGSSIGLSRSALGAWMVNVTAPGLPQPDSSKAITISRRTTRSFYQRSASRWGSSVENLPLA